MTMGCKWSGIGAAPEVVEVKEATSATFAQHDLVTISGGYATIATDGSVFGAAQVAATTNTTTTASERTTIPIQVITPDSIWIMASDTTTVATQVGANVHVTYTTAVQAVESDTTGTPQVRIERLDSRDGAAALGRLHVRFQNDVIHEWDA